MVVGQLFVLCTEMWLWKPKVGNSLSVRETSSSLDFTYDDGVVLMSCDVVHCFLEI